jgi:hypothetical protein
MNFRSENSSHGEDGTNLGIISFERGAARAIRCRGVIEMRLAVQKFVREMSATMRHRMRKISIISSRTAGAGPIPFAGMYQFWIRKPIFD